MLKQKIIDQNAKQIDLYQMVPCLRLYVLHSGGIQQKTSTIFIRTPDIPYSKAVLLPTWT